jgi:LmbE family N-acetylglucosaminyl deacetylase
MPFVDPNHVFKGKLVFTVPHMDDCVLACGGTIARLTNKERIHIIYASDGMASPAPILPWCDSVPEELGEVRMKEARDAMGSLGVPEENIHFLNLPEARLKSYTRALISLLDELIEQIKPDHILTPFRYDRHPDHLVLNRLLTNACHRGVYNASLIEYFVYYRWKLLPEGDVRKYINPQHLLKVNIEEVSEQKRAALDCFRSQTTRFYEWQTRPNLTPKLLEEVSGAPEFFIRYDASLPGPEIFSHAINWIRITHKLEPFLKKKKDQTVALLCRIFNRNG